MSLKRRVARTLRIPMGSRNLWKLNSLICLFKRMGSMDRKSRATITVSHKKGLLD